MAHSGWNTAFVVFLHCLLKFKPLDDFSLPKRDCNSLCVCGKSVYMCTSTEYRHLSGYHEHFLSLPFSNDGRMGHLLGFSSLYDEV